MLKQQKKHFANDFSWFIQIESLNILLIRKKEITKMNDSKTTYIYIVKYIQCQSDLIVWMKIELIIPYTLPYCSLFMIIKLSICLHPHRNTKIIIRQIFNPLNKKKKLSTPIVFQSSKFSSLFQLYMLHKLA